MDLIKIGEFIKEKRKSKNITQQELAERLSVTDRAVSKLECGKSLPDSGIMLELCEILGISVNELLSGKELEIKDFSKEAESNLIYVVKQKEETDKRLLNVEIGFGIIGTVAFLGMLVFGILGYAYWGLPLWALITMSSLGFVMFIITMLIALRIEQKA